MLSFCLKCGKNTESKKPKVEKIKHVKIMVSSNCAVSGSKKMRFIKEQEESGFLTGLLMIKSPFKGIPLLGNIIYRDKMNEIVNTFLLAGDKFMPEMHLRQPGFTYSAYGSFTKNRKRMKN